MFIISPRVLFTSCQHPGHPCHGIVDYWLLPSLWLPLATRARLPHLVATMMWTAQASRLKKVWSSLGCKEWPFLPLWVCARYLVHIWIILMYFCNGHCGGFCARWLSPKMCMELWQALAASWGRQSRGGPSRTQGPVTQARLIPIVLWLWNYTGIFFILPNFQENPSTSTFLFWGPL